MGHARSVCILGLALTIRSNEVKVITFVRFDSIFSSRVRDSENFEMSEDGKEFPARIAPVDDQSTSRHCSRLSAADGCSCTQSSHARAASMLAS